MVLGAAHTITSTNSNPNHPQLSQLLSGTRSIYSTNFTKTTHSELLALQTDKQMVVKTSPSPSYNRGNKKEQFSRQNLILVINTLTNCVISYRMDLQDMRLTTTEQVWIQVAYSMLCGSGFDTSL